MTAQGLLIVVLVLLGVRVAWADTHTFTIASGSDIPQCESTRTFANGWPPPFQDCYDNSEFFVDKDFLNGSPEYWVEIGMMRWDTSLLVGSTISSATLTLCVEQGNIIDDDSRSLDCEWYPNWTTPGASDFTVGSSSTALSVPVASLVNSSSPCQANVLSLTNPDANINKTGFTALRCTISGGQPTIGHNSVGFAGGNNMGSAPMLDVTFTSFTPTPGGGPTDTRTQTATATPTPTQTFTPTSCLPTVHPPMLETNIALPNGSITVPAPGIPTGRSAILSFAYALTVPNGTIGTWTGPVTDSAGNTWVCDGGTSSTFTIGPRTGCPTPQVGLTITQNISGGMCTLGLCHAPLAPGATISFPGQTGATTAAISLVDIENIQISAGSFRDFTDSITFDCQCYPPDGRGGTPGGLFSTINEGAINCEPGPFPPQTHSGSGAYYGSMSDGLTGTGGFSIPAGYLIWSSIGSEASFAPTSTVVDTLAAPSGAVLTNQYMIQPSTGTWSVGGTSAPQKWAEAAGGFAPVCEAAFVAAVCPATLTPTLTGPTPTATTTPPAPTQTEIAKETQTAGPNATITRAAQETQTVAARTATPTASATVTGTLPTATMTPTPNPQFGCCICPQPICSSAVTATTCALAGCTFGGVGTVCVEVFG